MLKSANQYIQFSDKIGGAKVVFEGHPYALVGGYNFDLTTLPTYPNVLPAGTPVYCDEEARTITPHYAFEVAEAVSSSKSFKVVKNEQGSRIKVGMVVMLAPSTIDGVAQSYKVTAVDSSESGYDTVTVGSQVVFSAGDILVEAAGTAAASDAKVKVVPNALLDRDIVKDANAKLVNATGIWSNDRPVLENRIPPIAPVIKTALLENGCYFRFSKRK